MNLKSSNLSGFISKILQQYMQLKQELQQQQAYKIVGKETSEDGKLLLTVQLSGKSVTFKATADEILADDNLVECFSSKDVRTMTYLACEKKFNKPKNKIVFRDFCIKLNQMIFGVKKPGSEEINSKTAAEISADKDLLNDLEAKDAHMVGYMAASELEAKHSQQKDQL